MSVTSLERELKRGSAELLILALLEEQERHGYQIGQLIAERSDGAITFHATSLYPTLYRLEDKGLVKSSMGGSTNARGGRRKRIFTVTSGGLAMLRSMKEARMDLWKLIPQLKIVGS